MRLNRWVLALVWVLFFCVSREALSAFKPDKYKEVNVQELKTSVAEYKNKYVFVDTVFMRYYSARPRWLRLLNKGFDKYYWLQVSPWNLPVIAEKRDFKKSDILGLKSKTKIRLYGKVKRISSISRKYNQNQNYFLELNHIEILKKDAKIKIDAEEEKDADSKLDSVPGKAKL
jgi:hypothetical protein